MSLSSMALQFQQELTETTEARTGERLRPSVTSVSSCYSAGRAFHPRFQSCRITTHVVLLIAAASIGFAAGVDRESQLEDIREAVFRWQFQHNASSHPNKVQVYFLALGEKYDEPSDAFMKRFANDQHAVQKVSACTADVAKGVRDKKTHKRGLIFRVISIHWMSDSEVEVKGGYYSSGLSASGNTYTLKKSDSKWRVTNDRLDWIA